MAKVTAHNMDIMAVNDVGMYVPFQLLHLYSNHADMLKFWRKCRRKNFQALDQYAITTHSCNGGADVHHEDLPGHGTSGLNAVYLGLKLGYGNIVLAGVPLDDSGHFFEAPWCKSNFTREVPDRNDGLRHWARANREIFNGRVKSLSGRTAQLLGTP
jgi:hypothetical protein